MSGLRGQRVALKRKNHKYAFEEEEMLDETKKSPGDFVYGNYKNIGHYQHDIEVFLNSKHTLRLVGGRNGDPNAAEEWARHDVIGLVKYAPAVIRLYRLAYSDNPYVDEALIKLEARIIEAEEYYSNQIQKLKRIIADIPSNTVIQEVKSTKPFHLKPKFGGNPYANKGVLLLASFDRLMTLMETCRSNFLIKRKVASDIEYHGKRFVRRVFVFPGEFKPCDVTRADVIAGNGRAKAIIEERGNVSEDVLNKKIAPEYGPVSQESDDSEMDDLLEALDNLGAK